MRFPTALLIILLLTVVLRLPSLFEPYWYGDEGIFAAVAHQMLQGDLLYRDTWDNKPPPIYLLYALSFAIFGVELFWVKLLATLSVLGAQILLFLLARRLFSQTRALFAVGLFALLVSLPTLEGNLALTEIFMLPAVIAAFTIALAKPRRLFFAGLFMSIPFLLKPVAGLEFAALFFLVFFIKSYLWKQRLLLCLGFLTLPTISFLFFLPFRAIGEYVFAAFLFFSGYLSWTPEQNQTSFDLGLKLGLFLFIVTISILWVKRSTERGRAATVFLLLWFVASWTSALFAGRPYPHYMIEAIPATALLLTTLPTILMRGQWRGRAFILLTLILIGWRAITIFPTLRIWRDGGFLRVVPYEQNFWKFIAKEQSTDQYNNWFDQTVNRNEAVIEWLTERLPTDDRTVYIWGDAPWIYSRANVNNPSRYVVAFHVLEIPGARDEVLAALKASPPRIIIVLHSTMDFLPLEQFLIDRYDPLEPIEGAMVWQRLSE